MFRGTKTSSRTEYGKTCVGMTNRTIGETTPITPAPPSPPRSLLRTADPGDRCGVALAGGAGVVAVWPSPDCSGAGDRRDFSSRFDHLFLDQVARHRFHRLGGVVTILGGIAVALVTNDPRFAVLKAAPGFGLFGIACLLSLTRKRPLMFFVSREISTAQRGGRGRLDRTARKSRLPAGNAIADDYLGRRLPC